MLHVSMVGCGAIGRGVLELLKSDPDVAFDVVIVPEGQMDEARGALSALAPNVRVATCLADGQRPDLLVECAGHHALEEHIVPALERGIPCMVVSVGALSEPGLVERLEAAARRGNTQVQLLSGAIGAIDALAAARVGGLDEVIYTGRKPARAWSGTPAAELFDLDALTEPTVIFEGSARDAARLYPKNANVAATVSLAGLGLDRTSVRLLADPDAVENVHHVEARGAFGGFELTMRGKPLAANPKTSALTVFSVVRALGNRAHAVSI
ncbi:L-aspartate dehydrogenase [Cupriavidus yeoncheonensis]|uniref:L-aspartate dehydrogenase n=1 Tax=Cupriavidus yeoncheonensis TaxID=1462994 RepID=A0A916ITQ4_9BURK|nr:aspartate dehydrogenase [Cupriavidus yeoncheonensis]CAG2141613.1 L-aspartate dehydrogenase [Cupriavidus yeoncheonensis]